MTKPLFDICYHCGQTLDEVEFFIHLKNELKKHNKSIMVFSLNPAHATAWEKLGMKDYVILPKYDGPVDINWAASFAKSLGISNFRSLFQTEQIFYDLSASFCQHKMAQYIHAVEQLRDAPKAKFYLTYGGDEFDHNAFRLFSRMMGGRSIYMQPANMAGRIAFFENEDRYWDMPTKSLTPPGDSDKQKLLEYMEKYTAQKTILWGSPQERDVKWKWNYPVRMLKRIRKSRKARLENPKSTNTRIAKVLIKRTINRFLSKRYYVPAISFIEGKEPFVYFPLHYPKDSQLTLRGKPFLNQASIVETVSRYVPYPYTLLVKEHPHARGWYDVSDIKKMQSLPNVKLIHPFTNSHDLIPKAKGIVAINSSVGYEGIMYRKPVIAMGRSFYRNQGVTIDVQSLYELEQAFEEMESFSLATEDVLGFLWKVKSNSYESPNIFEKSANNAVLMAAGLGAFLSTV